jgi:hypothetical protein
MQTFYYRFISIFLALWIISLSACAPPRRPHRPKPPKRPFTHYQPPEKAGPIFYAAFYKTAPGYKIFGKL